MANNENELTEEEKDQVIKEVVALVLADAPKHFESWLQGFTAGFKFGMVTARNTTNKVIGDFRKELEESLGRLKVNK